MNYILDNDMTNIEIINDHINYNIAINNILDNDNTNIDDNIEDTITWDDPVTPIQAPAMIDPYGWHWYPDSNGQLFTLYYDSDDNECLLYGRQDDGSFYWSCANVGYSCRDIGIEGRRGVFFNNTLVGIMILDELLTVLWLPITDQTETEETEQEDFDP
jgi:hypothetical protein